MARVRRLESINDNADFLNCSGALTQILPCDTGTPCPGMTPGNSAATFMAVLKEVSYINFDVEFRLMEAQEQAVGVQLAREHAEFLYGARRSQNCRLC